jgi:hypothetical protein
MVAKWIGLVLAVVPLQGVSITDPRLPGIAIEFKAALEPAGSGPAELPGGVVTGGPGKFYRVIRDAPHQIYFGYDVLVVPSGDGKNLEVRAAPLSASPEKLREMGLHPSWTKRSITSVFAIPDIRVGTKLKMRLAVNQAAGQEITDLITIREHAESKPRARVFTVADAELHFRQVQLHVNGALVPTGVQLLTGAAVWFYAPGHGRFVFSLAPHPEFGFTQIGEVTGRRLTITEGATVFELDSTIDIVGSTGPTFHVYGRHDRGWTNQSGRFEMGSADNPEWIR